MLLTIGMIVKNEEKYLGRCLSALTPILENVESELIIADTGSGDRTVEIARRFTDKVIHFSWINDFAAARNATLRKASGKWFMFVDADEIFTSCEGIIDFFNSGEYKKYNSASYVVRNLPKEGRGEAVDFIAPRLTEILADTKFIHPVHECYNTYGNPIKAIPDVAEHYGYTGGTSDEKFNRNSELLLKRLNEETPSPMLYQQLYDCFASRDETRALEFLDKGISLCKENNHPLVVSMYHSKINHLFGEKRYEEALNACKEYFAVSSGVVSTDVEVHGFMATCLNCLRKYSEAAEEYGMFFKKYDQYKKGKLVTDDVRYTRFIISSKGNITALFSEFLTACIHSGSNKAMMLAEFPVGLYPASEERLGRLVQAEVGFLSRNNYINTETFFNNLHQSAQKAFERLLRGEIVISDNSEAAINALERISFSDISRMFRDIMAGREPESVTVLSESVNINEYADILYIMVKNKTDISVFLTAKGFSPEFCARCCYGNFGDFYDYAVTYKAQFIKNPDAYIIAAAFFGEVAKLGAADNRNTETALMLFSELKQLSERAELIKLSKQVKENIFRYISSGHFDAAQKFTEEYKKINPSDPEIPEIESEIASKKAQKGNLL